MSYQVIARKYRPLSFADLAGQEHISRTLENSLESGRLHHAYLFSGVRGTGKTTTARILAKGLNCIKGVTSKPCLECASCLEIAAGNSLDVLEIDAASNTGVDNVREVIINNIAMAPARDRYKVFVIDEVHMLSNSAFNALLKTLEEPPRHVVFIMATTELHKLPDTILSRCQQFEFRQIPVEKIFRRLREIADKETIKISDGALREISRAGAGSLRDAQSAFDQVIAFSGAEITEEDVSTSLGLVSAATMGLFADAIAGRDAAKILGLVGEAASRGYDLRNFTRELMAYFRHLLIIKSGISGSDLIGVTDDEIQELKRLASNFSEEDLIRAFHLLSEAEKEIKDSPHPRFQLEISLVKLAHVGRLRGLDDLIKRLETLESQLTGETGEAGFSEKKTAETRLGSLNSAVPADQNSANKTRSSSELKSPRQKVEAASEPPDYPDFDQSEPFDRLEEPPRPAPPRSVRADRQTVVAGHEIEAIKNELQKLNRMLVFTALEDAQSVEYRSGSLIVIFGSDDVLARRVKDSGPLFRSIGENLFGHSINVEVKISGKAEEQIDEAEAKRLRLRGNALQNPAVKLLLEQTRGEILWVKETTTPENQT